MVEGRVYGKPGQSVSAGLAAEQVNQAVAAGSVAAPKKSGKNAIMRPNAAMLEASRAAHEARDAERAEAAQAQQVAADEKDLSELPQDLQVALGMLDESTQPNQGPPAKSVEFLLTDGRNCIIGEPDLPIDILLPRYLPEMRVATTTQGQVNVTAQLIAGMNTDNYEALLYVKSLDGIPRALPANGGGLMKLAAELRTQGLRDVRAMKELEYPEITATTLTVIKKNY